MNLRLCKRISGIKDCQDAAGQQFCQKGEHKDLTGACGSNLLLPRASSAVPRHRHLHHLLVMLCTTRVMLSFSMQVKCMSVDF